MPLLVNENGLTIQGQAEIVEELTATWQDPASTPFGPLADVSDSSTLGQLTRVHAEREAIVQQIAASVILNMNPATASGYFLDILCALCGVVRDPATYAQSDSGFCIMTGVTTVPAGSIVRNNRTLAEWEIVSDVVAAGAGTYTATIRGREAGVQEFLATDEWTITTPVSGWSTFGASLDIASEDMGSDVETDEELRIKRKSSLLAAGNDWEGIQAAIALVTGVSYVGGFNNRSLTTQNGVPGGAIAAVVSGGDDTAIAQAIYAHLPPGTQTFGDVNVAITMANGETLEGGISFSRPTTVDIYIRVTVSATGAEYAASANIATVLADTVLATALETSARPGVDVIPGALGRDLWTVSADARTGRPTLTSILVEVSLNGSVWVTSPISIAHTEQADFAASRVTIVGP